MRRLLVCGLMLLLVGACTGLHHSLFLSPRQLHKETARPKLLRLRGGDYDAFKSAVPDNVATWIEENLTDSTRRELGYTSLGFGGLLLFLTCLPIPIFGVFMNRMGLLMANCMIALGGLLVSGPGAARRYLLSERRRLSTAIMALGIALIYKGYCMIGFFVELLGFLNLFGPALASFWRLVRPMIPTSIGGAVELAKKGVGAGFSFLPFGKAKDKQEEDD